MQNRGTAASVSWVSLQPWAEQIQIPVSFCLCQSSCGFGLPMAELSQLGLGETVLTAASPRADREPTVLQLTCFCHLISDLSIFLLGLGPKFVGKKIPYLTFLTRYMSHSHSYGCYLKTPSTIYLKGGNKPHQCKLSHACVRALSLNPHPLERAVVMALRNAGRHCTEMLEKTTC